MPFVQMENISIFLRASQAPPLNLHQHDTFLTVDLYEQKDPAQVLQCLGAFSRAAHAANPSRFPSFIGPKARGGAGVVSPQGTGPPATPGRDRGTSITSNTSSAYGSKPVLPHRTGDSASGRWSPTKSPTNGSGSPGPVSSWSRREHEGVTSPAWNIAQYGYMGGASQGNLGVAFGARRQITSAAPKVPSVAEKERLRKEKDAEEERRRQEEEQRRAEIEAEEASARAEEERRWEEETQRQREEERRKAEEEKRRWEEQEREWQLTEEKRRREEEAAEARLEEERRRMRGRSDAKLRGQFLSQYQAEQKAAGDDNNYSDRVKELEKELELARQREAEYEQERQQRPQTGRTGSSAEPEAKARARSRSRPAESDAKARARSRSRAAGEPGRQDSYVKGERDFLQTQWDQHQEDAKSPAPKEPLSSPPSNPARSPRPLPEPTPTPKIKSQNTGGRPLPDPAKYASPPGQNRTDRYLASNPAPVQAAPQQTYARELGATAEQDGEDRRRVQSQSSTKAGGWASKSLLEREMEMERQRQREWEDAQNETAAAVPSGEGVDGVGGGIGGRWDVGQWSGFTGGDSQNKGGQGIGAGRRQIVGPRPLPGSK